LGGAPVQSDMKALPSLRSRGPRRPCVALTLIELLCVLAILAILAALYLPAVMKAFHHIKTTLSGL
jgi:prepilin-type N-terminal cleavage/methylation domain-containing protein